MREYFDYLDSLPNVTELTAPSILVERYGIEYRIAVSIVTEWMRIIRERENHAN